MRHELPLPAPETIRHALGVNEVAEIAMDAPAIATIQDGRGRDHDVQAYINLDGKSIGITDLPHRVGLSIRHRDGAPEVSVIEFNDNDEPKGLVAHERLGFGAGIRLPDLAEGSPWKLEFGTVAPTRGKPEGAPVVGVGHRGNSDASARKGIPQKAIPAEIEASPAALRVEKVPISQFLRKRNALYTAKADADRRSRKLAARFAAGLAIYGAIHSGGVVDRVAEVFHDAGDSVIQNFQQPGKEDHKLGIAEGDGTFQESVQRVSGVMDNWDDDLGGMAEIRKKADVFRAQHPDSLMPETDVAGFHARLEAAANNTEALGVIQDYLRFFDKQAEFLAYPSDGMAPFDPAKGDVAAVKAFGNSLIDAYGYLPKELIQSANFTTIQLAEGGGRNSYRPGTLLFGLSTFNGPLTRAADSPVGGAILNKLGGPANGKHVILHETMHGFDLLGGGTKIEGNLLRTLGSIGSRLINVPMDVSTYASMADEGEVFAEDGAVALNVTGDSFMAGPNEWRRFISPSNKHSIEILLEIERRLPGITAYLIDVHNRQLSGALATSPR